MTDAADYTHVYSGKVRDLYALPDGTLLFVASDRMSAYDFVLPTPIPDKGKVLTQLSLWWFERLADIVPNHLVSTVVPAEFEGRAMVCERLEMFPVECVARGYLTGSGLKDYQRTGAVCGVELPSGLVEGSRLPEPIFTPATKAALGEHDENIDVRHDRRHGRAGGGRAAARAHPRGLHQGRRDRAGPRDHPRRHQDRDRAASRRNLRAGGRGAHPDSSRFWPADSWHPGTVSPSFDKQYVRDWLTSPASGWDRASGEAPPGLPDDVVEATRARYVEAYERLTGRHFA